MKAQARTNGSAVSAGPETTRLDVELASFMGPETRRDIWRSADQILAHGPLGPGGSATNTGLALGFVQSGKTTSITALIATAADAGYRVVVALLGSTNLLLNQNRQRLERSFGIGSREDYLWVVEPNPSGAATTRRLHDWVDRGRIVLIPLLKHSGRINAAAGCLAGLPDDVPVLVVDDEADQASLNTAGQNAESRTYEAIRQLRQAIPRHLYVQYTATPYAPLLLDADDLLSPQFVEFLNPGPGYTGGREFFVDSADQVVRNVPALEEQATKTPPLSLPKSLVAAVGSFVAGAALLLTHDPAGTPVSMLVHSTARNDVQARYLFLLERHLSSWKQACLVADSVDDLPETIRAERQQLLKSGAKDVDDSSFLERIRYVLRETTLWLVNSASALNKVDWTVAPIHILIGGNKLDRGFTVEGLTVTFMNRPASPQVDTLEQRARAFGYRREQLPYCQFFGSHRTIRSLRDIVFTEYDLRSQLRDHVDGGGSLHSWAREIGLLLPPGMKPTRDAVVQALSSQQLGWHSLRRPALEPAALSQNRATIESTGLLTADYAYYGRLSFRTTVLSMDQVIAKILNPWVVESYSPSWRHSEIVEALLRAGSGSNPVPVLLMEDDGKPRIRKWDDTTGFINLFQGRDLKPQSDGSSYPGDRLLFNVEAEPEQVFLQVHRVCRRDDPDRRELLTLAIYLGDRSIVRKVST